jgi:hypothetical protein
LYTVKDLPRADPWEAFFFEKPLDKSRMMCYNKGTKKERK